MLYLYFVYIWLVYHFILLNKLHTYFIFNIVKTRFSIPSFTFILGFYFFFIFFCPVWPENSDQKLFFTIDDDLDLVKYGSYLFDKTSYSRVSFVTNLLLNKYYIMKNFQHKLDNPKDKLLSMPEIILIRLFNIVSLL